MLLPQRSEAALFWEDCTFSLWAEFQKTAYQWSLWMANTAHPDGSQHSLKTDAPVPLWEKIPMIWPHTLLVGVWIFLQSHARVFLRAIDSGSLHQALPAEWSCEVTTSLEMTGTFSVPPSWIALGILNSHAVGTPSQDKWECQSQLLKALCYYVQW